ncbi:MAG: PEP-CTERM sorting domain-containing protein [Acidobacteriia bacterium]|nr:PEP-CTERM sorting domain-containing protein [Terriglobia bacterium]
MDLLTRAKAFLKGKASKIALTVVPLAALTVAAPPSRASIVSGVTFEPGSCVVNPGTFATCSEFQTSPTGGDPGANWISVASGTITSQFGLVGVTASGNASGSVATPTNIPVSWDFKTTTAITSGGAGSYDVLFQIVNSAGQPFLFTQSGSFNFGTNVETTGTGVIPGVSGSIAHYLINLQASVPVGSFMLQIPGGSTLDLNPSPTVPTPEPSTLLLTGAGIAALLLRRKKKTA